MKRSERIYEYVKEATAQLTAVDLAQGAGVTTEEVAKVLGIQRTNTSKDLNSLVRKGLLEKLDGRPVRYVAVQVTEGLGSATVAVERVSSQVKSSQSFISGTHLPQQDIFQQMIGANGSMKTPVEQAKAAILYPDKGLNCLIIGPTGSGKTYFAHSMFQFAQVNQIVAAEQKLVVFNCADYAHNPELLMSHLFGYAQGAFTGATKAKAGIIEEADGSFLFLDEVHRLPPEGQEMIFYFMDHGLYARLGETTKERRANVRMICATTENPTSALLNTFVRRIPIIIQLPQFSDRPAKEKIALLKVLVAMEAARINKQICLTEDVVKALIGSVSYGNIGQLKSNVQLVTARSFLNHMEKETLLITREELTDNIKEGLLHLAGRRTELAELAPYLEPQMVVDPNEPLVTIQADAYELPYNLYEIIGDKAALLKADGLEQEVINNFITTDINVHLKAFYKDHGFTFDTEHKLAEIVDQRIIDVTKEIYQFAMNQLQYEFQPNFIYAVSLHISSFLKRIQLGQPTRQQLNETIKNMVLDYPLEYETAQAIKQMLEKHYQISIPDFESYYLAVLLISLKESNTNGRVGIVVAAHGKSTASSMVEVVEKLLQVTNLRAVDMPLEVQPQTALQQIIGAVKEVEEGSGVILLVDMGSLTTFTPEIQKQTGIDVRTVDLVTTPLVLEAARKTTLLDMNLPTLYESLKQFHGYAGSADRLNEGAPVKQKKRAILAICASGEGTAQRMREMLTTFLEPQNQIEIFTLSVLDVAEKLPQLEAEYQLLAVTGITNPQIQAPYIPMETFFSNEIEAIMQQLLQELPINFSKNEEVPAKTDGQAQQVCLDYLTQSFTFINPAKVFQPLWDFSEAVAARFYLSKAEPFLINLTMHSAGMLERLITQAPLEIEPEQIKQLLESDDYFAVQPAVNELASIFNLTIPPAEIYFILQIVYNEQTKDTEDTLF